MKRIAVFASGAGSNAQKIITHFKHSNTARVVVIACNKPEAGVISIAKTEKIPVFMIEKEQFFIGDGYSEALKARSIDLVVLAGFLWKIPQPLIDVFPNKIINIHPALLPKYGGKGMYGMHVHNAVIAAKEQESGITIHYVNENFDEGATIFQAKCNISSEDTPITLADKIHILEHKHFPAVIEEILLQ